jgi:hypothetical protein
MDRFLPHISIEGEEYFAERDAAATEAVGQRETAATASSSD